MDNQVIRFMVRNFYDIQRMRIAAANRAPKKGAKIDLAKKDIKHLQYVAREFNRLEDEVKKEIEKYLEYFPIWIEFLKKTKGCGPSMAGVILSEFDIKKANTISQFWAYDGLGMERQWTVKFKDSKKGKIKEQTIWATSPGNAKRVVPISKNGKVERIFESVSPMNGKLESQRLRPGQYPSYNTWLKTKMVGVLAGCFLKSNSPYRKFYDDYKHRKESENWGGYKDKKTGDLKSVKGHRDNAAKRYMIKMFLKDLWLKWRELEGLEVRPSYQEQYLRHKHDSHMRQENQYQ